MAQLTFQFQGIDHGEGPHDRSIALDVLGNETPTDAQIREIAEALKSVSYITEWVGAESEPINIHVTGLTRSVSLT